MSVSILLSFAAYSAKETAGTADGESTQAASQNSSETQEELTASFTVSKDEKFGAAPVDNSRGRAAVTDALIKKNGIKFSTVYGMPARNRRSFSS